MQTIHLPAEEKEPIESLTLTQAEYHALDLSYGLEPSVHTMIMLAKPDSRGNWVIQGTEKAFDALRAEFSDEIYSEASPPSRLKHLRKLYSHLSPDDFV